MNILIKLMSIVSLVIAPYIAVVATNSNQSDFQKQCKETGVCPESGKACTWDEATNSCKHNDGSPCNEQMSDAAKSCCKPGEGHAAATKACCKMDGAASTSSSDSTAHSAEGSH
jgi:hypothetical protein